MRIRSATADAPPIAYDDHVGVGADAVFALLNALDACNQNRSSDVRGEVLRCDKEVRVPVCGRMRTATRTLSDMSDACGGMWGGRERD